MKKVNFPIMDTEYTLQELHFLYEIIANHKTNLLNNDL